MVFGQTPNSQEIANHLRTEFGSGHPKIRLSLLTYLMENKVRPDPDNIDEFIIMADKLVEWTASKAEDFFEAVANMPNTEVSEDTESTGDVQVQSKRDRGSYL